MNQKKIFLILRILTGSFLYAVGFNVFVVPFGLFSGGAVGAAQLICIPVARAFRLNAEQLISIVYILLRYFGLRGTTSENHFYIKQFLALCRLRCFFV